MLTDPAPVTRRPASDVLDRADSGVHVEPLRRTRVAKGEMRPHIDLPPRRSRCLEQTWPPLTVIEVLRLPHKLSRPGEGCYPASDIAECEPLS